VRGGVHAVSDRLLPAHGERLTVVLLPPPDDSCSHLIPSPPPLTCDAQLKGAHWAEGNRLRHLKEAVFPHMDGIVRLLDVTTLASDSSFVVMNNFDDPTAPVERHVARVAGIARSNTLYKKLPKEQLYVPVADWAAEMERSEITEVLLALQMAGAVVVDFEHKLAASQPASAEGPTGQGIKARLVGALSSVIGAVGNKLRRTAGLVDPLSGRLLFRLNARPEDATINDVLAEMEADGTLYHLLRHPNILARLRIRMSRGILLGDKFTLNHYTQDNRTSLGINLMQTASTPPRTVAGAIDAGYQSNPAMRRLQYVTEFCVVYPDVKEGKEGLTGAADLKADGCTDYLPAASMHPLSGLNSFEMLKPGVKFVADATVAGGGTAGVSGLLARVTRLIPCFRRAATAPAAPGAAKPPSEPSEVAALEATLAKERGMMGDAKLVLLETKRQLFEAHADAHINRHMLQMLADMKGVPMTPSAYDTLAWGSGVRASGAGSGGGGGGGIISRIKGIVTAPFRWIRSRFFGGGAGGGGASGKRRIPALPTMGPYGLDMHDQVDILAIPPRLDPARRAAWQDVLERGMSAVGSAPGGGGSGSGPGYPPSNPPSNLGAPLPSIASAAGTGLGADPSFPVAMDATGGSWVYSNPIMPGAGGRTMPTPLAVPAMPRRDLPAGLGGGAAPARGKASTMASRGRQLSASNIPAIIMTAPGDDEGGGDVHGDTVTL